MNNSYEEFVREMTKSETASLSIGMRDKRGNILILGGWRSNLWLLMSSLYAVDNEITASPELAVEAYNKANNTKLGLDYIEKVFNPWYEKQVEYILVPSRSDPEVNYKVRKEPGGRLSCECKGFMYRNDCWHVQAVRELTNA